MTEKQIIKIINWLEERNLLVVHKFERYMTSTTPVYVSLLHLISTTNLDLCDRLLSIKEAKKLIKNKRIIISDKYTGPIIQIRDIYKQLFPNEKADVLL